MILAGVAAGGCGGSTRTVSAAHPRPAHLPQSGRPAQPTPLPPTIGVPAPGPTNVPAPAAALAVIRGWADTLRRGDVAGAARFFALPSVLVNGTDSAGQSVLTHIFSFRDAVAANRSLSCGAQLLSADLRGRYVNALFRLTDRIGPGGGCDAGAGQTARTNFVIADGRIVEWLRAPSDPGDGGGGAGGGGPAVPSQPTPAQQARAPVV